MKTTDLTKKRIIEYINKGNRFDNRSLLEYRPISIELGISNKAEGSAAITIGKTKVIAGVKLNIMEPYPDSEDKGTLMVNGELLPLASEEFQRGRPTVEAIELSRIIDRGIRESDFINFKKLCIKEGEQVWAVLIDIYPINDDGNLIDAAALASIAAIRDAVFPELKKDKEGKVNYGVLTSKGLPLTESMPLTLTFYKIGQRLILDPTTEEEKANSARISIAVSQEKKERIINAIQKGGDTPFAREEIDEVIDVAIKKSAQLAELFEEKFAAAQAAKKQRERKKE